MTTDNASPYEIHDERFRLLIVGNAELEELYSGCRWAEGPVWFADLNCLLFSDIPNERMLRWVPDGGVSVFRHPPTSPMAIRATGRDGWFPANMAAVASPAPKSTARSPFLPTATAASG